MSPERMENLQRPEVMGWEAENPNVPGPMRFFSSPLAPVMAEDGLPVPFPMDRSCVPPAIGQAWPQRAPSHPSGGHGDPVAGFLLDWERR